MVSITISTIKRMVCFWVSWNVVFPINMSFLFSSPFFLFLFFLSVWCIIFSFLIYRWNSMDGFAATIFPCHLKHIIHCEKNFCADLLRDVLGPLCSLCIPGQSSPQKTWTCAFRSFIYPQVNHHAHPSIRLHTSFSLGIQYITECVLSLYNVN